MPTGWPDVFKELLVPRGTKTLLGFSGRAIVVCGSVATAFFLTSSNMLDSTRVAVLSALGAGLFLLIFLTFIVGLCSPKRLLFGADELMRQQEQEWKTQSKTLLGEVISGDEVGSSGGDTK